MNAVNIVLRLFVYQKLTKIWYIIFRDKDMSKVNFEVQLPISIFREGKYFIAYTPALDLSTSAESFEEVKQRFSEVVKIFFDEVSRKGTLDKVLSELGWRRIQKHWTPPTLIAHESASVRIPASI